MPSLIPTDPIETLSAGAAQALAQSDSASARLAGLGAWAALQMDLTPALGLLAAIEGVSRRMLRRAADGRFELGLESRRRDRRPDLWEPLCGPLLDASTPAGALGSAIAPHLAARAASLSLKSSSAGRPLGLGRSPRWDEDFSDGVSLDSREGLLALGSLAEQALESQLGRDALGALSPFFDRLGPERAATLFEALSLCEQDELRLASQACQSSSLPVPLRLARRSL